MRSHEKVAVVHWLTGPVLNNYTTDDTTGGVNSSQVDRQWYTHLKPDWCKVPGYSGVFAYTEICGGDYNADSDADWGVMTRGGEFTLVRQDGDLDDADMWSPSLGYHGRSSCWIIASLVLLFVSNVLFMSAFLTIDWGLLTVRTVDVELEVGSGQRSGHYNVTGSAQPQSTTSGPRIWWRFGLWQCCRNDGFCLGTRWPGKRRRCSKHIAH